MSTRNQLLKVSNDTPIFIVVVQTCVCVCFISRLGITPIRALTAKWSVDESDPILEEPSRSSKCFTVVAPSILNPLPSMQI